MTPIKVDIYADYLMATKFLRNKAKFLIEGFKKGFDIGYRGSQKRRELSNNIPIKVGSHDDMWSKLMKEVKLGRHAGPFTDIPYQYYMQSLIGLVPKAGNQTRLIFHLSFDFGKEDNRKSLNFHTPDEICSVKYKDLDYAIKTCLNLLGKGDGERNEQRSMIGEADCGNGGDSDRENNRTLATQVAEHVSKTIFLSKSDLKSAFKILPILPEQRKFPYYEVQESSEWKDYVFCGKMSSFRSFKQLCEISTFFRVSDA